MTIPDDFNYSKEHQWVSVAGDTATIGITEYAQKELGEVIFVMLPEVGETFAAEAAFGTLESIKAVSEVYMPVAGKVEEVNQILPDTPEKLNEDPYGEGWLVRIIIKDPSQLGSLMSAQQYSEYIAEESGNN